ncbi:MAG: T9SS type A sorting domain-containing protein [Bacteroidota bacterium]|nr:T9SS type A sorting domain-containing protein [Bacteroidota bacterium]
MKFILSLFCFALFASSVSYSQDTCTLNVNRVSFPLNNSGNLAWKSPGGYKGALYDTSEFLYSAGFAFSGLEGGAFFVNSVMPSSRIFDYLPGRVGDTLNPKNVLYSVSTSDSAFGSAWQKWKDAVQLGADFYDGNHDGIYNPVDLNGNGQWDPGEDKPLILGDKTIWCVYNDGAKSTQRQFTDMAPKGVEIRQTAFAFNNANNCADNTIFIKYNITNTSNNDWDSCYFSKFADIDLISLHDFAGTCTNYKSIYAFNKTSGYPSCFVTNLQSPIQYIPGITFTDVNSNGIYDSGIDIPLDTAFDYRGVNGVQSFIGAENINSYNTFYYTSGSAIIGDPAYSTDLRNYQMAKLKSGLSIDPCNFYNGVVNGGVQCNTVNPGYIFSGDPISDSGWLQKNPDEVYQLLNIGPFKLKAHESNNLIFAYVLGKADTWQMSLLTAQDNTRLIRNAFKNNFTNFFTNVNADQFVISDYRLDQNYPNPFNPSTTINYQLPKDGHVSLKIYDILGNEVASLVNEYKNHGNYSVNYNASRLSSGVYIYRIITGGFISSKKMILIK